MKDTQNQIIVQLTGEVEGAKSRLKYHEDSNKTNDQSNTQEVKNLQDKLKEASQRVAIAEENDSAKTAKINELNALATKVSEVYAEDLKEKTGELEKLQREVEELKQAHITQRAKTKENTLFITLKEYAKDLLEHGNTGNLSGAVKGTPIFMNLYRKTHFLAKNPSPDALLCFLNLFAEAILTHVFSNNTTNDTIKGKINTLIEKCLTQVIGDTKKDKITTLLKVLSILINDYKGGSLLEDQATYYIIYKAYSESVVLGVPSITPDKSNVFFTNEEPPKISSNRSDLPYNVLFIMLLLSLQKYIQECRNEGNFVDANCDKISKPPVDASPTAIIAAARAARARA